MSDCIYGHIKIYGHIVYKVIHFHYVIYSNPRHVLTFDTVTPKSIGFLCYPGWMCGPSLRKIGQGVLECYRIGKCLQPGQGFLECYRIGKCLQPIIMLSILK